MKLMFFQHIVFKNKLIEVGSHLGNVCEEACCWKYIKASK